MKVVERSVATRGKFGTSDGNVFLVYQMRPADDPGEYLRTTRPHHRLNMYDSKGERMVVGMTLLVSNSCKTYDSERGGGWEITLPFHDSCKTYDFEGGRWWGSHF